MNTIVNIDTLEIGFDVYDYESSIESYLDLLEECKNEKRDSMYKGEDHKSFIEIGGIDFEVLHAGKHGYAYILHNDDMELNIAKFRSTIDDFYPIRVRFKAKLLWEQGQLAYQYVARFIRDNFNDFGTTKVGRVDFACHTDGIDLEVSDWDNFVGRHKTDQAIRFNRVLETLYFGSRKTKKCYCRIYNKSKKILRDKDGEWFFDIWMENGLDPLKVWNIEFELKRGMLKELGVESYEDLSANIHSIWIYLTGNWLTWRIPGKDSNKSRHDIRPEWIDIQSAYKDFEFNGFISRYRQRIVDSNKYIPAISGYITSISAVLNLDDMDDSIDYLRYVISEYLKEKKVSTFENEVKNKKKVLAQRGVENLDIITRMKANIPGKENRKTKFPVERAKRLLKLMEENNVPFDIVSKQMKLINRLESEMSNDEN